MYKKEEEKEAHLVEELCGFSKLSVAQEGSQQLEQVHQELGVHVPTLHTHTACLHVDCFLHQHCQL